MNPYPPSQFRKKPSLPLSKWFSDYAATSDPQVLLPAIPQDGCFCEDSSKHYKLKEKVPMQWYEQAVALLSSLALTSWGEDTPSNSQYPGFTEIENVYLYSASSMSQAHSR